MQTVAEVIKTRLHSNTFHLGWRELIRLRPCAVVLQANSSQRSFMGAACAIFITKWELTTETETGLRVKLNESIIWSGWDCENQKLRLCNVLVDSDYPQISIFAQLNTITHKKYCSLWHLNNHGDSVLCECFLTGVVISCKYIWELIVLSSSIQVVWLSGIKWGNFQTVPSQLTTWLRTLYTYGAAHIMDLYHRWVSYGCGTLEVIWTLIIARAHVVRYMAGSVPELLSRF